MSAWITQLGKQVKKLGADKASWYAEWHEPDGTRRQKSCGPGSKGKKLAERLRDRIKAELLTETYNRRDRIAWSQFVREYRKIILSANKPGTEREAMTSIRHFTRILSLADKNMLAITAARIDVFKSKRRKEPGKKPGSTVSPATINKDLRNIKAALGVAVEWGYLDSVPKIRFVKEPKQLPTYVTPEHFVMIYAASDVAKKPFGFPFLPADWWRGLIVTAQMTGWRISELLALRWADVDLDVATAITRAADNKGDRAEMVRLHPVVIDHLQRLKSFDVHVFPWPHDRRTLYTEFARIQDEAGIHLPCRIDRPHKCTAACHQYGFHDERRSFATMNAPNMTREVLQSLMRHKSPLTTQRYINMSQQLNPAIANLYVPDVLKTGVVG